MSTATPRARGGAPQKGEHDQADDAVGAEYVSIPNERGVGSPMAKRTICLRAKSRYADAPAVTVRSAEIAIPRPNMMANVMLMVLP